MSAAQPKLRNLKKTIQSTAEEPPARVPNQYITINYNQPQISTNNNFFGNQGVGSPATINHQQLSDLISSKHREIAEAQSSLTSVNVGMAVAVKQPPPQ